VIYEPTYHCAIEQGTKPQVSLRGLYQ